MEEAASFMVRLSDVCESLPSQASRVSSSTGSTSVSYRIRTGVYGELEGVRKVFMASEGLENASRVLTCEWR